MKFTSLSLVTGIAISGIVATGAFTPAHAATLLTTQAGYNGLGLDLSGYKISDYYTSFAPISSEITFTSNVSGGALLGQTSPGSPYLLNNNGQIDSTILGMPIFAGLDSQTGYMAFNFSTPVKEFGAFLNYAPGAGSTPATIATYDKDNKLISTFNLATGAPISTPGATNQFVFRGIREDGLVISSFRLSGDNIVAAGQAYNVPASTAVPEPFTIIGTIVGGSAALRMRKKLKSTKV